MKLTHAAAAALAIVCAGNAYAQAPPFSPPRLLSAALPPLPAPTVVGGGEVIIEATVDRGGALVRPLVIRSTPPYTQMVLDAMALWRFEPARAGEAQGREEPADVPVTIAAVWRQPTLLNTPTLGEPPKTFGQPSGDAARPLATILPDYPPQAHDGGVVLFEVSVDSSGQVRETRGVASIGGFESVARDALARWRFSGGLHRSRPVPGSVYVLFGFRPPVVSSGAPPR